MNVRFTLDTDLLGCHFEDDVTLPDDYTDEQIQAAAKDWAWERIELTWEKLAAPNPPDQDE